MNRTAPWRLKAVSNADRKRMLFLSLTTKTFIKIIFHDYFHLSLISLPSLVYLSLCLFLDLCQFICFSVQCVSSVPSHDCLHGVIRLHLLFVCPQCFLLPFLSPAIYCIFNFGGIQTLEFPRPHCGCSHFANRNRDENVQKSHILWSVAEKRNPQSNALI